jgi:hypothetical protein
MMRMHADAYILWAAEGLIHVSMPLCTPWPAGISACTTPRPAVNHCMHTYYGGESGHKTTNNIYTSACMHVNSVTKAPSLIQRLSFRPSLIWYEGSVSVKTPTSKF